MYIVVSCQYVKDLLSNGLFSFRFIHFSFWLIQDPYRLRLLHRLALSLLNIFRTQKAEGNRHCQGNFLFCNNYKHAPISNKPYRDLLQNQTFYLYTFFRQEIRYEFQGKPILAMSFNVMPRTIPCKSTPLA